MTLTVHHLHISQSERILFLLEELSLPYNIVHHTRAPNLSPDSLTSVPGNATGKSPFLVDTTASPPITLSESGAIMEYIIHVHGSGRLSVPPGAPNYADYLRWFHYANATVQAAMVTQMMISLSSLDPADRMAGSSKARIEGAIQVLDDRLKESKWLAGEEFTAADIINVYSVSTQRYFGPTIGLERYPNVVRWLGDIGRREGYGKAMEKGDPEMRVLLGEEGPEKSIVVDGGHESWIWRK